ncbi:MAG: UDP-N-acetylmuramate dehydrogenase [Coriobacteriaceae bacterium]|nr:UDP-N-acetylmuramate dehydrogenase [Coriobacteriaceae bacterium]
MMDKVAVGLRLAACFPDECILIDEPMANHTTFAVGGPADYLVLARDADDVRAAIEAARACDAPVHVIGCGSNILVSDAGLPGVVVKIGPAMARIEVDGTDIVAQAGATNEEVANAALAAGLSGYEFASGIPGSIGGAAIMDAGAYEGEFRDVGVSATCLAPDGTVREVPASEADWGYRHSMMMDAGMIVLEARIRLTPAPREEIRAKMDDLARRRAEKQPLELPSAGSTFKRPTGYFAGKLIQDAGMRGHRVGGAMVSEKHCGFVVNAGGATAADVLQVIRDVQQAVYEHDGVRLEPEVRLWGFEG